MLQLKNITKYFNKGTPDEKLALDHLNLTINDGEFVTIIGGNGSGKTTTMNILAGTYFADEGHVLLNNIDITHVPEHKRARYFSRVFQDPMKGTAPDMQIQENLSIASGKGFSRGLDWHISQKDKENYKELLKQFDLGLEDRLTSSVGVLSGGQRQALTLIMATLRNKPSHKRIIKDYIYFAVDDKTKAKKEVLEVYSEGKSVYKKKLQELKEESLSKTEYKTKKQEIYKEFDAKMRKFDITKQIMLLDEHTAALDPKTAKKVLELTNKIVTENSFTALMITHNMKDALTYGNRLIMFSGGKVILDVKGEDKNRLTVDDLYAKFNELEFNSTREEN